MTGIYFMYSVSFIIIVWCWPKIRAENGHFLINTFIKVCWLWLEIFCIFMSDTPTAIIHTKLIYLFYSH